MGFQDECTHRIRHEEARVTPHGDELPDFGRGDFQLGYRMDVNATRALLVKVTDAAGPAVDQKLAQWPHAGSAPSRPMRDHQVSQLE